VNLSTNAELRGYRLAMTAAVRSPARSTTNNIIHQLRAISRVSFCNYCLNLTPVSSIPRPRNVRRQKLRL